MKLAEFKILALLFLLISQAKAQDLTAIQVLEKSIAYHDPYGNWETFNDSLSIHLQTPEQPIRKSKIKIDLTNEYFYLQQIKAADTLVYSIVKDNCKLSINGIKKPTKKLKKKYDANCEKAKLYKNYYTYLYGLPMKLKDEGTIIYKDVIRKSLKNNKYLVIKVNYREDIGKDTWYFYFNPETYALEAYQFFKDESKNNGEYILLNKTENISNIKMPKIRKWFTNKDNKYLGTDILQASN